MAQIDPIPSKMGTRLENNGLTFTNFSRMIQNLIGQDYPELSCEALGIQANYFPMPPPPIYPQDNDPIILEGLMHLYDKYHLPLYLKEAGIIQGLNIDLDRNRKKAANLIKQHVTDSLRSFIEREHPISGESNWSNVDSIITIMQWIQSAYNLSISASSIDINKHYKSQYDDTLYTTRDTIDTFIMKFDEAYLQYTKHCPHRITLNEAITDFLHKLPSEFHNYRETMIMQEARNEELVRNNLPRINDTGYPLTLDSLYKQVSVVSRVHDTLSSSHTSKSFTSIHHRRSPSPHHRSHSPSGVRRYENMRTGELKSYDQLDMFDNPEEYGLDNCGTCLRNGFQGRHLQRFHRDFLRSKSSHTTRERSNFRTSKYRNRSRSRSPSVSSADDGYRRGRKDRSRSRSSSRGSQSDSRRGRHRSGKSSTHSPSPHSNRPPTPLPTVQFES